MDSTTLAASSKQPLTNTRRIVAFTLWGLGFLLLVVASVIVYSHPGPWPFDLQTTVTLQHSQFANTMSSPAELVSIVDDPLPSTVIPILWFIVLGLIGVFVWRRGG